VVSGFRLSGASRVLSRGLMNKEKRLANLALLIFATLSLLFLVLPTGPVVGGARAILSFATYPFINTGENISEAAYGIPAGVVSLLKTEQENRRLRGAEKEDALLRAQLEAALAENRRLAALAALAPVPRWKGIWAGVIERDPAHWNSSITINRGLRDGVAPHDPVIGVQNGKTGLVGKIIEVSRETSKVLLMTDDMFSVTCYVQGRGWDALAEGQGRELLRLNYLPTEAQPEAGAEVFTSPASVVYPPGLSIGAVLRVHSRENFMTFISADLVPTIRPGAVKEVYVLKKAAEARPK